MPQFKNQKFKVTNATIGRLLQEKLLAEGYHWEGGSSEVKDNGAVYFYTYSSGKLTFGTLESFFNQHKNEEVRVITENRLVIAELQPKRDKVIVFGKTYYKDDVEAALSQLQIATV